MPDDRLRDGAVLSRLIPLWVSETVLPARSAQVPVTDCPAPSIVRVWFTISEAGPENESEQVQLAVTFVLFQPLALGAVRPLKVMDGFVLSILIVTETELERFALLVAEQVSVTPVVSTVRLEAVQ